MRHKIITFVKKETILVISLLLAAISSCFVFPDKEYLSYIDWHTLMLLFSLMAVMAGYQKLGLFKVVGANLLSRTKHTKQLSLILVFLPFFFSMLITNDVALITFVPFAIIVLHMAKLEHRIVPIVILQTIAANLGSMVTPFGNPQNLYLSSFYGIDTGRFLQLMLPYALLSLGLLLLQSFLIPKGSVPAGGDESEVERMQVQTVSWALYGVLFAGAVLAVLRILSIWLVLLAVTVVLLLHNRQALRRVNYSLLLTFVFFFILIGNLGNISEIRSAILSVLQGHELLVSVLASQVVSNVPAAILLSGFTPKGELLVVGTNLGGLGTLIASMASIITFQLYAGRRNAQTVRYFGEFTLWNFLDLASLLLLAWLLQWVSVLPG